MTFGLSMIVLLRKRLKTTTVNIRSTPGLKGEKIDRLGYKTKVQVIAIDPYYYDIDNYRGHWIQIKYENKTGFIFEKYLYQYWQ